MVLKLQAVARFKGDGAEASGGGRFLWDVAEVQGCDDFYGMLLKFESMADFMECC